MAYHYLPFRVLRSWTCLLGAVLLLHGCASVPVDPQDESVSLVFGYFDMADAPSKLEWASLKRYGDKEMWYHMAARDGLIFHVGIAPGSYQVEKFGGMGGIPLLTRQRYEYQFGTRGRNDTAVRIQKAGIYFLGAYKYVDRPGGMFQADRFDMQPLKSPSEKELLQRLIRVLESDPKLMIYTRQIALAKRRLAALAAL